MILRRKNKKNQVSSSVAEQKPRLHTTKTLGRFRADCSGSSAIEFSMLAIPFFGLMFAIIESSLSFTAQQILANVTDDVARDVRTGRMKGAQVNEGAVKARRGMREAMILSLPTSLFPCQEHSKESRQ